MLKDDVLAWSPDRYFNPGDSAYDRDSWLRDCLSSLRKAKMVPDHVAVGGVACYVAVSVGDAIYVCQSRKNKNKKWITLPALPR